MTYLSSPQLCKGLPSLVWYVWLVFLNRHQTLFCSGSQLSWLLSSRGTVAVGHSWPIFTWLMVSTSQPYFSSSPAFSFCRRMAEATPKKKATNTDSLWTGRRSRSPPFLRLESSTVPNSFGKLDTKGYLT